MAKVNRIPQFSEDDFDHWRIRMQAHLAAKDYDIWYTVINGPIQITKANTAVAIEEGGPQWIVKPRKEWTAEDKRINNLDNVAKDILFKSLENNVFRKIKMCSTAKEIWEKLAQIYEGNDQTK